MIKCVGHGLNLYNCIACNFILHISYFHSDLEVIINVNIYIIPFFSFLSLYEVSVHKQLVCSC